MKRASLEIESIRKDLARKEHEWSEARREAASERSRADGEREGAEIKVRELRESLRAKTDECMALSEAKIKAESALKLAQLQVRYKQFTRMIPNHVWQTGSPDEIDVCAPCVEEFNTLNIFDPRPSTVKNPDLQIRWGCLHLRSSQQSSNPQPSTLNPQPSTPNPKPQPLNPTPGGDVCICAPYGQRQRAPSRVLVPGGGVCRCCARGYWRGRGRHESEGS